MAVTSNEPKVIATSRYSINETCELLGITRKTLQKYTVFGRLFGCERSKNAHIERKKSKMTFLVDHKPTYLFLLVLVGAQLLLTALGAQHHILVVFDLVVFDVAAGYLDGAVGDIVDEGAVVAHQHHGFGRLGEKLLKPLYAFDVEVVGRLVEQEHVGLLQENLGELDAHAPATGELARGAVEVAALEAQTGEGALEGGFVVVAAEHHVAVVLESELLDQLGIALALVVGAVGHLLLQPLDALFHAGGVDEGFAGLFDDGGVVGEFHHLGQIAYGGVVGDGYGARGGLLLSAEYLEHGRFAGTVLAHERYAVAVVDDETHVMEERAGAELYSEIFYMQVVLLSSVQNAMRAVVLTVSSVVVQVVRVTQVHLYSMYHWKIS